MKTNIIEYPKPKVFTFFTKENLLKTQQAEYDRRKQGLTVVK